MSPETLLPPLARLWIICAAAGFAVVVIVGLLLAAWLR